MARDKVTMLYLQRHAESSANAARVYACRKLDPELTDEGRTQARAAAAFYEGLEIRRIISSPSRRTLETAEIIASALGLEAETDPAFLEVDVGEFEGKSYHHEAYSTDHFFAVFREWLIEQRDSRFPGGESRNEVEERVSCLDQLSLTAPTIIVGHGAFFAFFLGQRMSFADMKELFLPSAGIAHYCEAIHDWIMESRTELKLPDRRPLRGLTDA
jgi:probable phosphoglycerate mutase